MEPRMSSRPGRIRPPFLALQKERSLTLVNAPLLHEKGAHGTKCFDWVPEA